MGCSSARHGGLVFASLVERSPRRQVARLWIFGRRSGIVHAEQRAVVQLGRTLEWGSRGRGFESRQPDGNCKRDVFYVYALKSQNPRRRYIGSCENLNERIRRHNSGHSKATRHGIPWTLLHSESFLTRREATTKERYYKTGRGRAELAKLEW
jgi:putative endonuclease